jgi:hypothetical protein
MAFSSGAAGVAGSGDVDEVSVQITDGLATSMYVKCLGSSTNSLLINAPTLHAATWLTLEAGDGLVLRFGLGPHSFVVNAKALDNSSDASITWGVAGKMPSSMERTMPRRIPPLRPPTQ